jgi:hypothetical protein
MPRPACYREFGETAGIGVAMTTDGAPHMDRQQLEALLSRRFPGSTPQQIAAAVNAIMAMIQPHEKPADTDVPVRNVRRRVTASSLPLPRT